MTNDNEMGAPTGYANALHRGTMVRSLRILDVLGDGAFGITYLAENALGQKRALKEFFPDGMVTRNPDNSVQTTRPDTAEKFATAKESFRKEAEIIVGLNHPNIVKGLDFFDDNNTCYFVMPFYEGQSCDRLILAGQLIDSEAAHTLVYHLLDAMEYIHTQNVYHRDIKPANIFIIRETGQPILLDFGAAKRDSVKVTRVHTRIGTAHYRAPEQASDQGNIGAWTDIYGLAATIYRLISGNLPEDAVNRYTNVYEGMDDPLALLTSKPELVEAYGTDFLSAIHAGLNLKRQDRPQSAGEWLKVFDGASSRDYSASPRPDPVSQSDAPKRHGHDKFNVEPERTPFLRYAIFALLVISIGGGGVYLAMNPELLDAGKIDSGDEFTDAVPETVTNPDERERPASVAKRLSESEAWIQALELDTLEAYREFIRNFPKGANVSKARAEIDRLDEEAWTRAQASDTISAYQGYIDQLREGRHVAEARAAITTMRATMSRVKAEAEQRAKEEAADWASASAQNTAPAYETYLAKHPAGANAAAARASLADIQAKEADQTAFDQAKNLDTKQAYQTYLNAFPQGQFVPQAMESIANLTPTPGKKFKDCDICPQMIILPSGDYQQGAGPDDTMARSNEKPERRVEFRELFAIGVTEITFDEYDACVAAGACKTRPDDQGWGRGRRPVINVTYGDAKDYTNWLSSTTGQKYDLPTESQWEYAARAGEISPWLGSSTIAVCAFANGAGSESPAGWANKDCSDPAPDRTMPTGALAANKFGLKDVLGNVSEWTQDCVTLNYRDAPSNGEADTRGSCGQRPVRGGSWFSGPRDMRLSARMAQRKGDSTDYIGFRVVRELKQ